jgi:hypothetical protein
MCYLAAQYWNAALAWIVDAHRGLLFISLTALLASLYGAALLFVASVQRDAASAGRNDRHKLIASFLLSQIGKYVPGRIWSVALQKVLLGADLPIHSAVLTNLELAALSVALTGGAAIAFMVWSSFGIAWGFVAFTVVGLGLLFALMLAFKLSVRAGALLRRLLPDASPSVEERASQKNRKYIPGVTGLVLYGAGYCAGWLCLMLAGEAGNLDVSLRLTALLSLSYVVGVVSLLPAGMGSREAALLIVGGWWGLDTTSLASVAIVARLAGLVVEVAAAILGAAMLIFQVPRWRDS